MRVELQISSLFWRSCKIPERARVYQSWILEYQSWFFLEFFGILVKFFRFLVSLTTSLGFSCSSTFSEVCEVATWNGWVANTTTKRFPDGMTGFQIMILRIKLPFHQQTLSGAQLCNFFHVAIVPLSVFTPPHLRFSGLRPLQYVIGEIFEQNRLRS